MARPPKALAQVEGHLTKAQRETRENAEKQLSSDEKIEMSAAVKKSKVAKDLFKRVTGLLDSIGMNDAFYEPVINRYCVMTAECETLEHDLQRTEELLDTLEDRREDMEFTDYVQYAGQLMATKQKITAGLDKKRAMLLQIEKENVMTVMGKLRAVPKKAPEEELEEDPMMNILNYRRA